jgi:hypothetical protein
MIWKYVLSGKVRVSSTTVVPRKNYDRFSLLRVCRQIYHETATLPYTMNTFFFEDIFDLKVYENSTKRQQLQYIQSLAVGECCKPGIHESVRAAFKDLPKLPALKEASVTL